MGDHGNVHRDRRGRCHPRRGGGDFVQEEKVAEKFPGATQRAGADVHVEDTPPHHRGELHGPTGTVNYCYDDPVIVIGLAIGSRAF